MGQKKNIQPDMNIVWGQRHNTKDNSIDKLKGKTQKNNVLEEKAKEHKRYLKNKEIVQKMKKVKNKSKRNNNFDIYDSYSKHSESQDRSKVQPKLNRPKLEKGHSRKISKIAQNLSLEKDLSTVKESEKVMLSADPQKFVRRSTGNRIPALMVNQHDEIQKEIDKKKELRRKANEKYNTISANYKLTSKKQGLKYIIMKGNNSQIIEKWMSLRPGWQKTTEFDTMFNFRWQQTSNGIKYSQLSMNGKRQLVNHMEHHHQITTKDNLFTNMWEHLGPKVFEYVPMTFWIQTQSENYSDDIKTLRSLIKLISDQSSGEIDREEFQEKFSHKVINDKNTFTQKYPLKYSKKPRRGKPTPLLNLPESQFAGHNIWILKVTKLNRGRGIYVLKADQNCTSIINLIEEIDKGIIISQNETPLPSEPKEDKSKDHTFSNLSWVPNKIQSSTFVIQKYIEKPLLINKRKFDIRVWVLLTADLKVYFFKEGYLRTSCEDFSLETEDISKTYVHLTNNAVQKYSENYGQFEDGNQLSFQDFQDYITKHYADSGISVKENLVPKMKDWVITSFKSAEDSLFQDNKRSQFELFGYDFIIDEDFKCWLIEINTNPCLEESSRLLKKLIPRMVDDALKLTLDPIFKKKPKKTADAKEEEEETSDSPFPVDDYPHTQNLWEFLL